MWSSIFNCSMTLSFILIRRWTLNKIIKLFRISKKENIKHTDVSLMRERTWKILKKILYTEVLNKVNIMNVCLRKKLKIYFIVEVHIAGQFDFLFSVVLMCHNFLVVALQFPHYCDREDSCLVDFLIESDKTFVRRIYSSQLIYLLTSFLLLLDITHMDYNRAWLHNHRLVLLLNYIFDAIFFVETYEVSSIDSNS